MSAKVFKRAIGSARREQCIYTPDYLLDCVDKVFPGGWWDPYPAEDPSAPAARRCKGNGWGPSTFEGTFANPPYAELKTLLPKGRDAAIMGRPSVHLVPLRTRTTYWCEAVRGHPVGYLDATTFHGFKGTFPENLVVIGFGVDPARLQYAFAPYLRHFQEAF